MATKKKEIKKMRALFILWTMILIQSMPCIAYGQQPAKTLDVEDSAEVMLEEYTDEFQEAFFEGMKQKGIQNYDRAVNFFLDCKRLQPDNHVIDHELAKTYLLDKEYSLAEQYAVFALKKSPDNYWYLDTLIASLVKQSNSFEAVASQLPTENEALRKNLAVIYFKRQQWNAAKKVLGKLANSDFKKELLQRLSQAQKSESAKNENKTASIKVKNDPVKSIAFNLSKQLKLEQYPELEMSAKEAVELYPLQPFFYYAYGVSLYKNDKTNQAVDVLESGLDFLFDDVSLANKFYQALYEAYTKANNISRANEYLRKIKPGF